MSYSLIELKDNEYRSTGGQRVTVTKLTQFAIYNDKEEVVVAYIPDYFRDPKGIANGMIKLLNSKKILLNLEI